MREWYWTWKGRDKDHQELCGFTTSMYLLGIMTHAYPLSPFLYPTVRDIVDAIFTSKPNEVNFFNFKMKMGFGIINKFGILYVNMGIININWTFF